MTFTICHCFCYSQCALTSRGNIGQILMGQLCIIPQQRILLFFILFIGDWNKLATCIQSYHQQVVSAFPFPLSEDLSKDSRWKLNPTEGVSEHCGKNWTEQRKLKGASWKYWYFKTHIHRYRLWWSLTPEYWVNCDRALALNQEIQEDFELRSRWLSRKWFW